MTGQGELNSQDRMAIQKTFEKRPYQSKKFLAFLLLIGLLSSFVLCALSWGFNVGWPLASVLITIIFTMGFVTLAFNGKQAHLDLYTRGIAMTGLLPDDMKGKIEKTLNDVARDDDSEVDEL